jgi:phosphoglucomutase
VSIREVEISPFEGQRPGTSGLRKKVREFQQPGYLESFVQATFDVIDDHARGTLVVGGDGRYHNRTAIDAVLRIAAANGFERVVVGRGGLLSTPAASCLIRALGATGGILLTASHNPGGPDGDFGIKFNTSNGGPAPERITEAIHAKTRTLRGYRIHEGPSPDIDTSGIVQLGTTRIEIVDPVDEYARLMERLFDLDRIADSVREQGLRVVFDAMHAVTGPYARRILSGRLGLPADSVRRGEPLEDFGGCHPDPNLTHAGDLATLLLEGPDAPDLGAASDGDGDRNMILGRGCFVTPSDSLAVIAANARCAPGYADGLAGVARSMPTSRAVDRVAEALGIACYETPTGWKFFGNLLDAGRITLCGEESFGTGSNHVREKDGLWAVLFWLSIIAERGEPVERILHSHWYEHGRTFYTRHDYEGIPVDQAETLMERLRADLPALVGGHVAGRAVTLADDFRYEDPVDGSVSERQGLRIVLEEDARVVYRLSGTGTEGATLRVYIEAHERDPARYDLDPQAALADLVNASRDLAGIAALGRRRPDVVT